MAVDTHKQVTRLLVTGAAGGVGHRVCHVLAQHGYQVRGLVRPEDDVRRLHLSGSNLHTGYVEDPECVRKAVRGMDGVVHCAALLPDASSAGPEMFDRVNVEGTRIVMEEAIAAQTKWLIAMSTISVVDHVSRAIGPSELLDYTDNSSNDPYLGSKIAAETMLRQMKARYAGELAILRLAYVYGPGNFVVWRRPLQFVRQGKFRHIGDGNAPFPLIYADDIGRFIVMLLDRGRAGGHDGVHVLADPQPTTLRSVFEIITNVLGMPAPGSVPIWAARTAAAMVGAVPRRLRAGPLAMLTRARVEQFSRGYDLSRVLDRPCLDDLGMMDFREGLRLMLEDYATSEGLAPKA